jgi:hypothetical protein
MLIKSDSGELVWRPTLKQERFLSVPLSVKEGFYAGAVGAGKSDVLLMYPIVHGWHKHPQFKGLFLRRTMPELRNEIIPRARDYFRHFGGKFNAKDGLFTFPSGALYFMGHCEHETDVHNYDSMQPNYAAFDELTSFTEWIYLYITIERVRVNENLKYDLPMIARSASNPGNIGHPFVFKRFIKPYPDGGKIIRGNGGIKRIYIPATIDDNPHISQQYKDELDALPEAERKAKKGGDWTAYEGQVFDEFRDKHYPSEPDNALHIIDEFNIPSWWPRIMAIDWGFSAMCSVGWGAISPDKRLYVYRHQMFLGEKIEEWAPKVKYWVERDKPSDIIICHSASQNRGDPHTILEQVNEALGESVRLGERDRIGGKLLLHEFLRWKPKIHVQLDQKHYSHEHAMHLLRNGGQQMYNDYLKSFQPPEDETNLPRLQFFNNPEVRVICDAIKSCVYEKSATSGKKKEDVAEFPGDDPYDMLRMLIHAADAFFGLAEGEQKRLARTEQIVNDLAKTGDMTAFYRNARKIEIDEMIKPVKRFHRARLN